MIRLKSKDMANRFQDRYTQFQLICHVQKEYQEPLHSDVPGLQSFWLAQYASRSFVNFRIVWPLRQYAVFSR